MNEDRGLRIRWRRPIREEREASGRIALVQAQLLIVITVVVLQLWLLTVALEELLGGHYGSLWSLVALSGLGFLVAAVVVLARREE